MLILDKSLTPFLFKVNNHVVTALYVQTINCTYAIKTVIGVKYANQNISYKAR